MEKGRYLILVGPDATGKTGLAKNLARLLNWAYYHSPSRRYAKEKRLVELANDPIQRYEFFYRVNFHMSERAKLLRSLGVSLICDRGWIDTAVAHRLRGIKVDEKDYDDLEKPDLTIYLTCSIAEQVRRLQKRNQLSSSEKITIQKLEEQDYYYNYYTRLAPRLLKIDTTSNSKQVNLQRVLNALSVLEII